MRPNVLALIPLLALAPAAAAAEPPELPRVSPAATVQQRVGVTDVELKYHRPAVRGRVIWGELVPYGKIWRLGANQATTLRLSHPARVAGKDVPAGTYALFAIPERERWTFVLNKQAEQWGAYSHDTAQDLVRFEVTPTAGPAVEWLTLDLTPVDADSLALEVAWDELRLSFPIDVDVSAIVWKSLDAAVAAAPPGDWETFHQAARYASESRQRVDEGLAWVDRAIAANAESFWNYDVKGRLLQLKGRTDEAVAMLGKAIEISKGKAPDEYRRNVERTIREWQAPKEGSK